MANLEQKYHVHTWSDLGVTLKRFYLNKADEVGTVDYWRKPIMELYYKMPFPNLWENLKIEIWNMESPDLLSTALVQLDDFNLTKDGSQVAAGLHYGGERIALAVFNDEWRARWSERINAGSNEPVPDPENPGTPAQKDIDYARQTLSHEIGHWYARESGLFGRDGKSYIQETTLNLFKYLYDGGDRYDSSNLIEKFAEAYRATLGIKEVRGTLGNGKTFTPSTSFFTLMKCIYWLNKNLRSKNISNFSVQGRYCQWLETTGLWIKKRQWYAVTRNWERFKWVKKSDGTYGWTLY